MLESIQQIDKDLFILIHHGIANPVFDFIMPILREAKTWIPLYLFFAFFAIYKYKVKGLYLLFATALVVLLADQFASGFMKPTFERLRPCNEPSLQEYMRSLIGCGGLYGFVSSHAANHFGMAVIFTWFFKNIKEGIWQNWVFYFWAAAISFAQIYVAKHYPLDVIVGGLAGFLIAKGILFTFNRYIYSDKELETKYQEFK